MANVNFGIDDMKAGRWTGATPPAIGDFIDLPGRALSLDTEAESEEWEADNKIIDIRKYNKKATGDVEVGVHDPTIAALFGNGEVTTTGTAPNQVTVYTETDSAESVNLEIAARSYGGDGTVVEIRVFKATIDTGPSFDWGTGAFSGMTASYEGVGNADGDLWSLSSMEGTAAVVEIPIV